MSFSTSTLWQKYQKKMDELKQKLRDLTKREEILEDQSKTIAKTEEKRGKQEIKITLSIDSVVKSTIAILLVFAGVYLLGFIKGTLVIFLVALFLSAAFNPAVDRLEKYHIPRWLGIILMYLVVLGIVVFILTSLVPIIAQQLTALALSVRSMIQNLVENDTANSWFLSKIQPLLSQLWQNVDQAQVISTLTDTLKGLGSKLTDFAGNALGAIFAVFNGIFNTILVLIITFFMVVSTRHTTNFFYSLFPQKYSAYITAKSKEVSVRIGEWIRGQVLLCLAMGVLTFIVLSIIGLNYALTLSMVSAVGEFIPYLGPAITFVSAALIAVNQEPVLVLWLIPAYAVIQFVESNIMVPLIIGRSVGLNPIIVMFSLLVGATLGSRLGDGSIALGLVGMIVSVPIANIISIFVREYTEKNK